MAAVAKEFYSVSSAVYKQPYRIYMRYLLKKLQNKTRKYVRNLFNYIFHYFRAVTNLLSMVTILDSHRNKS